MHAPKDGSGSGFVIGERRIITNAHVVTDATRVLVRRHGNAKKYLASVLATAHEADLALLEVHNDEFWENLEPLHFGGIPHLGDSVIVLGYPTGGDQLSITEGVVSRVGMSRYSHSSSNLLTVQIDAAINPGNSGGPAMHFLDDLVRHNRYTDFPTLGFKIGHMENDDLREFKGLNSLKPGDLPLGVTATGVLVIDVDTLRVTRYRTGKIRVPFFSQPIAGRQSRKTTTGFARCDTHSLRLRGTSLVGRQSDSSALRPAGTPAPQDQSRSVSVTVSARVDATREPISAREGHDANSAVQAGQHGAVAGSASVLPPSFPLHRSKCPPARNTHAPGGTWPGSKEDLLIPDPYFQEQQSSADGPELGLKVGDVILAIGGKDVAAHGTVAFRQLERVSVDYTVAYRFNGETCDALILRDGSLQNVLVPLTVSNLRVPRHRAGQAPKYFVFGGLVFTTLTQRLMEDIRSGENLTFLYHKLSKNAFQRSENDEIVVLTAEIQELAELVRIVDENQDQFLEFTVDVGGSTYFLVVLDRKKAIQANPLILEQHGILKDRSTFL
ncbi:hypothetical protein BESB_001340 [Besnoitia besnoiti]|uniref:Protease Do-like PDZ domain-containing protein n=1 Tax=Besnoitia besnoiti TaxID=94643 RepID=A0A2A9MPN7_BESBE|nr:hypothetical protein BESB_001340 [Besnoitia besnoiti]PFH37792.1 hypothetical protein BESB_001340 [Besnoitia besnoiti]